MQPNTKTSATTPPDLIRLQSCQAVCCQSAEALLRGPVQGIQAKVQELITHWLAAAAEASQPMMPVTLLAVCCSLHILQVRPPSLSHEVFCDGICQPGIKLRPTLHIIEAVVHSVYAEVSPALGPASHYQALGKCCLLHMVS